VVVNVLTIYGGGTSMYGVRHSSVPVKVLGPYRFRELEDVTSSHLLDCLNKRMKNIPHKTACRIMSS